MARIGMARVRALLEIGDTASSTTAKGAALEECVRYVFEKFPGVEFIANHVRDLHGVREIDVFMRNRSPQSRLDFLHWLLIIECKNLARPVGYQDVVAFKDLLQTKNCPSGILVAAAGIAGEAGGERAFSAIEDALKQRTTILVLTRTDLEGLTGHSAAGHPSGGTLHTPHCLWFASRPRLRKCQALLDLMPARRSAHRDRLW